MGQYFFLLTVDIHVLVGVVAAMILVAPTVLLCVEVAPVVLVAMETVHPTVRINAMIVGALPEAATVVTEHVEVVFSVVVVTVNVIIHVKLMGVEKIVILHAGKTVKVHAVLNALEIVVPVVVIVVTVVLVNVDFVKVTVTPVVLVPPNTGDRS